jgi:hypothetical protein
MNANWTIVTQSQERDRNSRQPWNELAKELLPLPENRLRAGLDRRHERGAEGMHRAVERERPARADAGDEEAGERDAADPGQVPRQAEQRIPLLKVTRTDDLRDEARRRRAKKEDAPPLSAPSTTRCQTCADPARIRAAAAI